MLSSVGSSVPQLTPLPIGPDDAPQVCAPRKKRPPQGAEVGATTSGGTTASTAGTPPSGTARTSRSKTSLPRAKPSAHGYASSSSTTKSNATSTGTRSTSTAKATGPLAFLDDPKLSVEEKLLKLLGYLNDKWNKELDQKMKEFKQPSSGAASSTPASPSTSSGASGATKSSTSSSGGLLKKAVGYASQAIPGLGLSLEIMKEPAVRSFTKAVAGPALAAVATYYGQPQLAPIALKLGPELADAAANAASAVTDGEGGANASAATSSGMLSGLFSGTSSGGAGLLSSVTSGLFSGTSAADSSSTLTGVTSGGSSDTSSGGAPGILSGITSAISSGASPASPSSASTSPGTSAGATTKESASGIGSDRDAQLRLMEMQRIIDQQKEMFSLVSNLLRATHETRMAVVQNVR